MDPKNIVCELPLESFALNLGKFFLGYALTELSTKCSNLLLTTLLHKSKLS